MWFWKDSSFEVVLEIIIKSQDNKAIANLLKYIHTVKDIYTKDFKYFLPKGYQFLYIPQPSAIEHYLWQCHMCSRARGYDLSFLTFISQRFMAASAKGPLMFSADMMKHTSPHILKHWLTLAVCKNIDKVQIIKYKAFYYTPKYQKVMCVTSIVLPNHLYTFEVMKITINSCLLLACWQENQKWFTISLIHTSICLCPAITPACWKRDCFSNVSYLRDNW